MSNLIDVLALQKRSDSSLMDDAKEIRRLLKLISANDDIVANKDLVSRTKRVLRYLPQSIKDIGKNREEIRDVVFSGFSLVAELKSYLYQLRKTREKRVLEYQ